VWGWVGVGFAPGAQTGPMDHGAATPAVLLTWNPGPRDDRRFSPLQWYDALVAPHARGEVVTTSWGVGRHVNGFAAGQPAYLYRQGAWGRGLVARGALVGGPRPDPERSRNLVDVVWAASVPVDHALEVADLEAVAPGFAWRQVWSSGRHLPPEVTRSVGVAWDQHLDDVRRAGGGARGGARGGE